MRRRAARVTSVFARSSLFDDPGTKEVSEMFALSKRPRFGRLQIVGFRRST